MVMKRHKLEEIVTKLRQFEVLYGQGMARVDAIRQTLRRTSSYYRKQHGETSEPFAPLCLH